MKMRITPEDTRCKMVAYKGGIFFFHCRVGFLGRIDFPGKGQARANGESRQHNGHLRHDLAGRSSGENKKVESYLHMRHNALF